jgi:hypothetical protein
VDWLALAVVLQHKDARPFAKRGILFNQNSVLNRSKNIVQKNIIRSKLPKAVQRKMNFAAANQRPDLNQEVAHAGATR